MRGFAAARFEFKLFRNYERRTLNFTGASIDDFSNISYGSAGDTIWKLNCNSEARVLDVLQAASNVKSTLRTLVRLRARANFCWRIGIDSYCELLLKINITAKESVLFVLCTGRNHLSHVKQYWCALSISRVSLRRRLCRGEWIESKPSVFFFTTQKKKAKKWKRETDLASRVYV